MNILRPWTLWTALLLVPGFALGQTAQLLEIMVRPEELPVAGFVVLERLEPSLPVDFQSTGRSSGTLFKRELRPSASQILGLNLYGFPSEDLARSFFDRSFSSSSARPVQLGDGGIAEDREADGENGRSGKATMVVFRRGRIVVLMLAGTLDGNAGEGEALQPHEALDLDTLLGIAQAQDLKIRRWLKP